jgi:hypothetical protein
MKREEFVNNLQTHLFELFLLIDSHMLPGRDTEEDSQRLCLINRLRVFKYSVNGIHDSDMK